MKLTINEVVTMFNVLEKLSVQTKNFKISYWITRNIKALNDTYTFFVKNRQEVFEKYLKPDETGSYCSTLSDGRIVFHLKENTEEFAKEFNDTFNELMNTECEIEPYTIDLNTLMESSLEVSAEQIMAIECLIIEND